MLAFLYGCALKGVGAARRISRLYRLQRVACSACAVSVSRSERETTVEGWTRKRKRGEDKRQLKRKALTAVKADPLSTRIFTEALYLDGS